MASDMPWWNANEIEVLSAREAVRRRATRYLGYSGPLDAGATHRLIGCAVAGVIWHYRRLGHPLDRLVVQLPADGSAVVTSYSTATAPEQLLASLRLLRRGLHAMHVDAAEELFFITALSAVLHVEINASRETVQWLAFAQGEPFEDGEHTGQVVGGAHIRRAFWPDFTILERVRFDRANALEQIRPFAISHPLLTIDVVSDEC